MNIRLCTSVNELRDKKIFPKHFKSIQHFKSLVYKNCGAEWLSRYSDSLHAGQSWHQDTNDARFYAHVQTGRGAHLAFYKWVQGHSRGKGGWDVELTTHPHLVRML